MKKKAWPWTNSQDSESLSKFPINMDSQEHPATLSIGETHAPNTEPLRHEDGIQSPLQNSAKDKRPKKVEASIDIFNNDDMLATFSCDIAKSLQDKIAGLQTYDDLSESAGLLFEYSRPEDVVYHMGSVKFPIDILFVDKDDKIKKIYRNIQPGTLATFGCAEVKNVLEICGGLSDRLGISTGNRISISKNKDGFSNKIAELNNLSRSIGSKSIIIKYSNIGNDEVTNWKRFPILNINNNIIKTAKKQTLLSDFVLKFMNPLRQDIHIFDFDGLIEQSPYITVYKLSSDTENSKPYIKLDGTTASIVKNSSGIEIAKDLHINDLLQKRFKPDIGIISSLNKSFKNFMKTAGSEDLKMFSSLRRALHNKNSKALVVTRFKNSNYLKKIIASKYNLYFGEYPNFEIYKIHPDADPNNIIDQFREKFGNQEYKIYSDPTILKRAGNPISDSTKDSAKEVYKKLDGAYDLTNQSLDNLSKNVKEYEKIKDDPEATKKTKGIYNQSCKNNKELFKKILISVRDSIKTLNQIKDTTITPQVIESLTSTSKSSSDSINEIFNLVDQIESLPSTEFFDLLTKNTETYKKTIQDLQSSIDKGKKHINGDILGLIILSD